MAIVDTPRQNDTRGPEDDIVNAFSIAKAMRSCASLRVILVFSESSLLDKAQGFANTADTLSSMFSDFSMAARHIGLWITKPTGKLDEQKIVKKLRALHKQRSHAPSGELLKQAATSIKMINYESLTPTAADLQDDLRKAGKELYALEMRRKQPTYNFMSLTVAKQAGIIAEQDPTSEFYF